MGIHTCNKQGGFMSASLLRQKRTVSITLDPELYRLAKQIGINLSATLAEALKREIRSAENEKWKRDNQDAFQELNRISDEHGLLSDEHRTF
jgi:antitoxin CcdA